jgi:hypothetical protein
MRLDNEDLKLMGAAATFFAFTMTVLVIACSDRTK